MKVYAINCYRDKTYAEVIRQGSWDNPKELPSICPECTVFTWERVPPLIIEWEPGSDKIGDFTHAGYGFGGNDLIVTQKVRDDIEGKFTGFEFHPVEMRQNPKLKNPEKTTKRSKPRVWLPYQGPQLWDLYVTARVKLDLKNSEVLFVKKCNTCGTMFYRGIFKNAPEMDALLNDPIAYNDKEVKYICNHDKIEYSKTIIDPESWHGESFFRISEWPAQVYVTEEMKKIIENSGFTNIKFRESDITIGEPKKTFAMNG